MKKPKVFNSISDLHRALGLPKPLHPLLSLVDYSNITADTVDLEDGMIFNFYKVSYKQSFSGKIKYGQTHYDFDEGGLSFIAPNQVIISKNDEADYSGYTLLFHPDFIRNFPLGKNIKNYGFFSYSTAEALYLSDKEKETIIGIFKFIEQELSVAIDNFSQEVMVSQLDLLLSYSKRFYNRQFITRKNFNTDILTKVESILNEYFDQEKAVLKGLPTVQDIAGALNVSSHYLSDMLRSHTGMNTQQHIHNKMIEKAKELLATTTLSIAEVAYKLGFEHPQSFNKIFKKKTATSPLDYRHSLN